MSLRRFLNDRVTLIKKYGRRFDNLPASVQSGKILTNDPKIPIEDGDWFERQTPSGITDNLIGPNTRVNIQSSDSSTNIVNGETSALFDALRKSLDGSISDHALQQRLRETVDAMQVSAGTRSFSERYKDFIALAASRHCLRAVLACTYTALAVTGRHVRSTQSSGRPTSRCGGPGGAGVVRAPVADRSVSQARKSGSIGGVLKHREVRASLSPYTEHALSLHCVEK